MQHIDSYSFKDKKALIRVDFNVPLNDALEVTDNTRIKAAIPTILKVLADGGSVILMSHMGRPKAIAEDKFSLKNIVNEVAKLVNMPVKFVDDCIGEKAETAAKNLKSGEILLLENLRFYKQETTGTESFAKELASLGDVYINDAFGTAHRAHASTTVVAKFFPNDKMFGYLLNAEITSVSKVLSQGKPPITAIVGGAKVSSKIVIINNLMDAVQNIIIGGGMAYTFAKALGGNVGNSLIEDDFVETAKNILEKAKQKGVNIILPIDTLAANKFDNEATITTCDTTDIPDGYMGLDIGPKAIEAYVDCIEKSNTILWNGPMGVFEMENFRAGTKAIADAIVKATSKGGFSLIGGGDSVAAINMFGLGSQVSHVSTGGGAMLEYLEGKELPGIAAIMN
ncbi:MAG: phosphoglycerate kinase [Flavobacteriales bacterium]|jgi:phosphoglycerate kinase